MDVERKNAGGRAEAWGDITPDAARRLVSAAVEAFAERGYHATTTRDIAGRAGMSPAALYIHYKTKEELLHRISRIGTTGRAGHPGGRRADGGRHARRAARRRRCGPSSAGTPSTTRTARVVQYELDALGEEHRAEIVAMRRRTRRRGARDPRATGCGRASSTCRTCGAPRSPCCRCASTWPAGSTRGGAGRPTRSATLYADLVLRMVSDARRPASDTAPGPSAQR